MNTSIQRENYLIKRLNELYSKNDWTSITYLIDMVEYFEQKPISERVQRQLNFRYMVDHEKDDPLERYAFLADNPDGHKVKYAERT